MRKNLISRAGAAVTHIIMSIIVSTIVDVIVGAGIRKICKD